MYVDDIKIFAKNEKELIQTIRMYSQDVGMEFGIEKYAVLIMKKENRETMVGITLPIQERIRMLKEK